MTVLTPPPSTGSEAARLPYGALLALAMTGFLAIMTETLPAGLLPEIGRALHVSASRTGQLVTAYAAGSLLAAIPLTAATQTWRRRPILLLCIGGFLFFNIATVASSNYPLTLAIRFLAGVAAGLSWGILAGYARSMVAPQLKGRAIAVAMAGTPIAFSLGVPAGTLLAHAASWRIAFLAVAAVSASLAVWVLAVVPDLPGQPASSRLSVRSVLLTPGVRPVLAVVFLWMTAHNILYTYVAPFLALFGLQTQVAPILLTFGVCAIAGIGLAGLLVDRMLRALVLLSLSVFTGVALVLGSGHVPPPVVYTAIAVWGVTFGGAATLLQAACDEASGEGAALAPSLVTTAWNLAIAAGGASGGFLLNHATAASFPWALALLLLAALVIASRSSKHGFTPPTHAS